MMRLILIPIILSSCGGAVAGFNSPIDEPAVPSLPAVRGEQVRVEPIDDPCIFEGVRYDEYQLMETPIGNGTTEWGFIPCRPYETPVNSVHPSYVYSALPETK